MKERIRNSLVSLLETTPLDDITVTALCEKAKINRASYYYHYNSIRDVFDELKEHMEYEFNKFLAHSAMTSGGEPEKSFYVMFFEFVERNSTVIRMMINSPQKENSSFAAYAINLGRDKVMSTVTQINPDCPPEKIHYYYTFVSHGFLGLLNYWLNSGMKESVSQIAEIGEKLSYCAEYYLKPNVCKPDV